jgi:hypothetical protein
MSTIRTSYKKSVFINCPFDGRYKRIFDAIVFVVYDCGFIPRSALEAANDPVRLSRIIQIINDSLYAIHDLSRAGVDSKTGLARFNMPLELGIFLGAKEFGGKRNAMKTYLMLDRDRYRYQKFISDLNGIDPKAHNNKPETAIIKVRDWLNDVTNVDFNIQSGSIIAKKYDEFRKDLPGLATDVGLKMKDLTYRDYCYVVQEWLNQFPAWKRF